MRTPRKGGRVELLFIPELELRDRLTQARYINVDPRRKPTFLKDNIINVTLGLKRKLWPGTYILPPGTDKR
jgi:hypothetical protein